MRTFIRLPHKREGLADRLISVDLLLPLASTKQNRISSQRALQLFTCLLVQTLVLFQETVLQFGGKVDFVFPVVTMELKSCERTKSKVRFSEFIVTCLLLIGIVLSNILYSQLTIKILITFEIT